jgi:hypothetical protein
MKAKISLTKEVSFNEIKIGKYNLEEILNLIHDKANKVILNISFENQSDNPDYTDIDSPLHGILNLIEEIQCQ